MAKQILRAIDRWRFEAPLAAMLGIAAGFAVVAMPAGLFAELPLAGGYGLAGQGAIAVVVAVLGGTAGYMLMRVPGKPAPVDETQAEVEEAGEAPVSDRLRRLRRADRHPDAPPRAPIRASRDLGEPLMEVGLFFQPSEAEEALIPDGEFVELADTAEPVVAGPDTEASASELAHVETETLVVEAEAAPVADVVAPIVITATAPSPPVAPAQPARAAPRAERPSLDAMIDRLSAGLERRAGGRSAGEAPVLPVPRDMRPALRDALEELNRLAARRF